MDRCRFLIPLALLACSQVVRADGTGKSPVPSDPAQQEALGLVKEVYGQEWADAKTDRQKQALAKKLLAKAAESAASTDKYVLLRVARDVATQAGDGVTACEAIDEMDGTFLVDALAMKAKVLRAGARMSRWPAQHKAIAEYSIELVDDALVRDDFDMAAELADLALEEARAARDAELTKAAAARKKEVEELAGAYRTVQAATKTLQQSPTDPAANLAVGRYRCFVKGDWGNGLPMLALGSDPALKALAVKELEGVSRHAEQAALGDAWWDLAEQKEGTEKEPLQGRAAFWYGKALPGLTGLVKKIVEKRLEVAAGAVEWQFRGVANYVDELPQACVTRAAVPSELAAQFRDGGGRVWGICMIETATVQGKTCGWFGKGIVWEARNANGVSETVLTLESEHISTSSTTGPACALFLFNEKGERLAAVKSLISAKTLEIRCRTSLDAASIEMLGGSRPITDECRIPDTGHIIVVLGICVRRKGEKCDTKFTLKRGVQTGFEQVADGNRTGVDNGNGKLPPLPVQRVPIKVSVRQPWPVSFPVRKGTVLEFAATGRWRVLPGGKWHGPGDPRFYLQGRLGEGAPFRVGANSTLRVAEDSILCLGMKEGGKYGNNSGEIQVVVTVTSRP